MLPLLSLVSSDATDKSLQTLTELGRLAAHAEWQRRLPKSRSHRRRRRQRFACAEALSQQTPKVP
jgi:hypothetical protein